MNLTRVNSSMLGSSYSLRKVRENIPAFQFKKDATLKCTDAGVTSALGTGAAGDHIFRFHDGDMITDQGWVVSDRLETTQTIYCSIGEKSYKFPAGYEVLPDVGTIQLAMNNGATSASPSNDEYQMIGSYAIYLKISNGVGSLVYSKDFSLEFDIAAEDTTTTNVITMSDTYKIIGGFEFSPYAPAYTFGVGGAKTTTINQWSIWDLQYKPRCDPRGMTCVAGNFWVDIYFTASTIGIGEAYSRFGSPVWNGSSVATHSIIHPTLGYDILTAGVNNSGEIYPADNYEVATAFGKAMMKYEHFIQAATGVVENKAAKDYAGLSGLQPDDATNHSKAWYCQPEKEGYRLTSMWGAIGITGCHWTWGDFQSGAFSGTSNQDPKSRGTQYYNYQGCTIFSGAWTDTSTVSGSRTVNLTYLLTSSNWNRGSRSLAFF